MITLPAGRYIIGDPSASIPFVEWPGILERTDAFISSNEGSFKSEKTGEEVFVVAFQTAHGDGTFTDKKGREYEVSAGLIGAMLADGVEAGEGTNIVEFKHDFMCSEHNGVIEFGSVIIDTCEAPPDDGYEDDYDFLGDDE